MMPLEIPWLAEASRRKKFLVGVSGGLDSMALLYLLSDAGFTNLVVCHLDHGLRGKGSTGDASFVKRMALKLGFALESVKVDLRALMKSSGNSLETAGRMARHTFFAECSKKHRCNSLLLAHHADDQAETVLWNLMRGSSGCRGMEAAREIVMDGREMEVSRPLLSTRKAELELWMREKRFKWREDATNAINDVSRNRLRNEALPLLCDIAKRDVIPMLARSAIAEGENRELVAWAIAKANVLDPQGRLHLNALRELPSSLQAEVIKDFLKSNDVGGIGSALLERCSGLLDISGAPSVNLPGGGRLRRKAGRIFIDSE